MTTVLEPRLTARDRQVLRRLADGCSTRQTALALSITSNTVRTRIRRLEAQLSVVGRAEVVRRARDDGLV